MTKEEMILYSYIISANKYRYNYGRQANKTFQDLTLPELDEIRYLTNDCIKADYLFDKSPIGPAISLESVKWDYFNLGDERLFTIKGSRTTPINDLELYGKGIYPYITTQAKNNGVSGFYDMYTENGGCFTIDSAVSGYCSWHEANFSASDHVEKLIPNFKCNNYIAMFLVTIINREQYRYNYGIKCNQTRIKNMKIKLPVKTDGTPDWKFMENYIKSLPYSANI